MTAPATPFRIRDVVYAPGETQRRHAHDELQISVIFRGVLQEEVNGVAYRGRAGDVVVKPAGLAHANAFEATRIICLDADPRDVEMPRAEYAWHRGAVAGAAAVRLATRFVAGADPADAVDDLLAALLPRLNDRGVAARAAAALDETFATGPSIDALAADLGVHRVYLARVFRAHWGCSPREYVQHARVRAAARGLASMNRPLADVALDAGFSDQAHMSRVFLRATGMTPAVFRRSARG